MSLPDATFYKQMLKHLGPHGPDALLAFGMVVASGGLIAVGLNSAAAVVLCAGLFLAYAVRQTLREKHLERMKRLDIQGQQLRLQEQQSRATAKLEKMKDRNRSEKTRTGR